MELEHYRHPSAGFGLPLPADWERVEDAQPGVSVIAVGPDLEGPWFRPNIVVTIEQLPPELDIRTWQDSAGMLLPDVMNDFILIDLEELEVAGRPGMRRLAHHQAPEHGAVTMEQWSTIAHEIGYTVTASVGTLDYGDLAETFLNIAKGLRLETP